MTHEDVGGAVIALLWGGAAIGAFGHAFLDDVAEWHRHRDSRARRQLLDGLALFVAALASGAALVTIIVSTPDVDYSGLRRLLSGLAFGAFTACGIIRATRGGPA